MEKWTKELPTEQAWYWHWNENPDDAPFIYTVLKSGTNGKCFVANSSIKRAPWVEEISGYWMKIMVPEIPSEEDQ